MEELYRIYRVGENTPTYRKNKKAILGKIPEETSLCDFPGDITDTAFGQTVSNIVDRKEYYAGRIDRDVPLHQIGKSRDLVYISGGSALFSFGHEPGNSSQRIGRQLVANQDDIVERFPLVAWKIQPVKIHGITTPLFVRGLLDPPFDEKNYKEIKIITS